jgi:hypothetical protein
VLWSDHKERARPGVEGGIIQLDIQLDLAAPVNVQ